MPFAMQPLRAGAQHRALVPAFGAKAPAQELRGEGVEAKPGAAPIQREQEEIRLAGTLQERRGLALVLAASGGREPGAEALERRGAEHECPQARLEMAEHPLAQIIDHAAIASGEA